MHGDIGIHEKSYASAENDSTSASIDIAALHLREDA